MTETVAAGDMQGDVQTLLLDLALEGGIGFVGAGGNSTGAKSDYYLCLRHSAFSCFDVSLQDLLHLGPCELAIDRAIDHDHGGQAAAAEAGDLFQREETIFAGFAVLDFQHVGHGLGDAFRSLDVTGGAVADADHVLAHWLQTELGVERGHAVDLPLGAVGLAGQIPQRFLRQVAIMALDVLKQRDSLVCFRTVARNHFIDHREVNRGVCNFAHGICLPPYLAVR